MMLAPLVCIVNSCPELGVELRIREAAGMPVHDRCWPRSIPPCDLAWGDQMVWHAFVRHM